MKYIIVFAYILNFIFINKANEKNSNVVIKTKGSELVLTNDKKTSNIVIKDKHKGSIVLNNDKKRGSNIVLKDNTPEQGTIVMNTNKKAKNIIIRDKYGSLVVNTKKKGSSNIVIKENPKKPMVTYETIHEPIFEAIKEPIHEPLYQPIYEHLHTIHKQFKINEPIQEPVHESLDEKIHETLLKPIYKSSIERNDQTLATNSAQEPISKSTETSINSETCTDVDFMPSVPKFSENMNRIGSTDFGKKLFHDYFSKNEQDLKLPQMNDFSEIPGLYMDHLENPLIEENIGTFDNKNEKSAQVMTDYEGTEENKEKAPYSSDISSFPERSLVSQSSKFYNNHGNLPKNKNNDYKYSSYFDEYGAPYNNEKLKDIEKNAETSVEQQVEHQIEDQIASGEIVTNGNYDQNNEGNNYHLKALKYDYPEYIKSKHIHRLN